jgi:hypothetical protein
MKAILGHAKGFLKQTESRSLTFDKFPVCLDSTVAPVKKTLDEFDYDVYKQKIKTYRDILSVIQQIVHSTRSFSSISSSTNRDH